MLTLSSLEKLMLNDIVTEYFDNIDNYTTLVSESDVRRILYNQSNLVILTPWDTYIDMSVLGQYINNDILFLDTKYRELKRFSYSDSFGDKPEHIEWINSLRNGQQIYLRISSLTESKCLLCLVCNELPNYKKKLIVQNWMDSISWINPINISNTVYLNYPGIHTIRILYLNIKFDYTLDRNSMLNAPELVVIEKNINNQLTLFNFNQGYYLFQEIQGSTIIDLKLSNIRGISPSSLNSLEDSLYYIGEQNNIQILLNVDNRYAKERSATKLSLIADLVP